MSSTFRPFYRTPLLWFLANLQSSCSLCKIAVAHRGAFEGHNLNLILKLSRLPTACAREICHWHIWQNSFLRYSLRSDMCFRNDRPLVMPPCAGILLYCAGILMHCTVQSRSNCLYTALELLFPAQNPHMSETSANVWMATSQCQAESSNSYRKTPTLAKDGLQL